MTTPKPEAEPVSIKLPLGMKARLQKLGKLKQRSPHFLMKEAIENYLDAEEQLEKLKKKTLSRWEEAGQGLTIDNDAVTSWLATWGEQNEQERPKCE